MSARPSGADPKRWRRRALTVPGVGVACALGWALAPALLPAAAAIDLARGTRFAWTRALSLVLWILWCEVLGLLGMAGLWAARPLLGGARYKAWSYGLQRRWAGALGAGVLRAFDMRLDVEGQDAVAERPCLVLVRHTSIADSLLPMLVVVNPGRARARYVLKRELRWDPCLDVHGARFPNAFLSRRGGDDEAPRVAALAADLGPDDVIVLYPEGTRFSPRKRARRLEALGARGAPALDLAQRLQHTLPPHVGGLFALLDRAPTLDVVFLAHTGLERVRGLGDAFNGHLIGQRLQVALWRVPATDIPTDTASRHRWLMTQWHRLDRWVAAHPPDAPAHEASRPSPPPARAAVTARTPPAGTTAPTA